MALVKRQHIPTPVTPCEDDDRSVSQAEAKVGVLADHVDGGGHVVGAERLEVVCPAGDIVQQL